MAVMKGPGGFAALFQQLVPQLLALEEHEVANDVTLPLLGDSTIIPRKLDRYDFASIIEDE